MNNKICLISISFILIFLLNTCGFKPIYSEKNYSENNKYHAVLISENTKEIKSVFNEQFTRNTSSVSYKIEIKMTERLIPLVTNSDGTVSKYKIEIYAEFDLINLTNNEIIHKNSSRGFSSYAVVSSEYNTEENKKIALKQAARETLQILITKIQNHIAKIS